MTIDEAIRILDPETTAEALAEIEYYNGFSGKTASVQAVSDACILAVAALQEQEELERGCEYCNEDGDGYRKMIGAFSITNPFHGNVWNLETRHCKPRRINFCPMCGRRLHLPKPTPSEANN